MDQANGTYTVGWPDGPPPAGDGRRTGPFVLAAVMAVLVLVGGVATFALRAAAAGSGGAGSPTAAAETLVGALAAGDLDRAATVLVPAEARLLEVYGRRQLDMMASKGAPAGALKANGVRFRTVGPAGKAALVELADGTFTMPAGNGNGNGGGTGAGVQVPVSELNRRLEQQTDGKVGAVRLVAVSEGNRWRISLMASALRTGLAADGRSVPATDALVSGPTRRGASSAEEAVRELASAISSGDAAEVTSAFLPDEARLLGGARPTLANLAKDEEAKHGGSGGHGLWQWLAGVPGGPAVKLDIRGLKTAKIADGVVRVTVTEGTVTMNGRSEEAAGGEQADIVAVRQDGVWYPSVLFTMADRGQQP
jgi:hypothetical protein